MMTFSAAAFLAGAVVLAAPIPQDPPPPPNVQAGPEENRREVLAPAGDLDTMTLVRSSEGKAVVRFGPGGGGAGLIVLEPGDRVGRTGAIVREVAPDRLVVEEVTRARDGRPRRAQIVFREGHPGGRRYMRDPGIDAPTAVRPDVVGPDGKPITIKKPGKGL